MSRKWTRAVAAWACLAAGIGAGVSTVATQEVTGVAEGAAEKRERLAIRPGLAVERAWRDGKALGGDGLTGAAPIAFPDTRQLPAIAWREVAAVSVPMGKKGHGPSRRPPPVRDEWRCEAVPSPGRGDRLSHGPHLGGSRGLPTATSQACGDCTQWGSRDHDHQRCWVSCRKTHSNELYPSGGGYTRC